MTIIGDFLNQYFECDDTKAEIQHQGEEVLVKFTLTKKGGVITEDAVAAVKTLCESQTLCHLGFVVRIKSFVVKESPAAIEDHDIEGELTL